jgi:hypothetical protein
MPGATAGSAGERAAIFSVTEALDRVETAYRDGGWRPPYRAAWAAA